MASGRVLREWELVALDREIEVAPGVRFAAWTFNGRDPGPDAALPGGRAAADHVRQRLRAPAHDPLPRHPPLRRTWTACRARARARSSRASKKGTAVYEFDALPSGLHLYHCHVRPLAEHIAKGLYGAFLIDPGDGREDAEELVMVINGFDTNFDRANELYAANTIPFAYMDQPLVVQRGELVRLYLVNVLEYDLINSFHLHGNLFHWYPTGTSRTASELTDTVMLCQGQRGILSGASRHRPVHVPRAPVRVHRARLAGLLRGVVMAALRYGSRGRRSGCSGSSRSCSSSRRRALRRARRARARRSAGPPVEELAVERTVLEPGVIELTVRNDGPDAVTVAQALVNDAFVKFSGGEGPIGRLKAATVHLQQPWMEGEAYEVALLTSTGATIAHEILAAVATPATGRRSSALLALLGIYVGVIPVALGMLWLPWVRRIPPGGCAPSWR